MFTAPSIRTTQKVKYPSFFSPASTYYACIMNGFWKKQANTSFFYPRWNTYYL